VDVASHAQHHNVISEKYERREYYFSFEPKAFHYMYSQRCLLAGFCYKEATKLLRLFPVALFSSDTLNSKSSVHVQDMLWMKYIRRSLIFDVGVRHKNIISISHHQFHDLPIALK
jgi:hypothetical protein